MPCVGRGDATASASARLAGEAMRELRGPRMTGLSALRPDHRFLDEPRGIFADLDPGAGGDHQAHPAGLGELERGLRVLVDENLFRRGAVGGSVGEQRLELRREVRQALGEQLLRIGLELAVGHVGQAVAFRPDQPPAGGAEAGSRTKIKQWQIRRDSPAPRRGCRNCPTRSGRRRVVRASMSSNRARRRPRRHRSNLRGHASGASLRQHGRERFGDFVQGTVRPDSWPCRTTTSSAPA